MSASRCGHANTPVLVDGVLGKRWVAHLAVHLLLWLQIKTGFTVLGVELMGM